MMVLHLFTFRLSCHAFISLLCATTQTTRSFATPTAPLHDLYGFSFFSNGGITGKNTCSSAICTLDLPEEGLCVQLNPIDAALTSKHVPASPACHREDFVCESCQVQPFRPLLRLCPLLSSHLSKVTVPLARTPLPVTTLNRKFATLPNGLIRPRALLSVFALVMVTSADTTDLEVIRDNFNPSTQSSGFPAAT